MHALLALERLSFCNQTTGGFKAATSSHAAGCAGIGTISEPSRQVQPVGTSWKTKFGLNDNFQCDTLLLRGTPTSREEQCDATEFSVMSCLLKTQLLEPSDRGRSCCYQRSPLLVCVLTLKALNNIAQGRAAHPGSFVNLNLRRAAWRPFALAQPSRNVTGVATSNEISLMVCQLLVAFVVID